jgi:cysteine desulfurase
MTLLCYGARMARIYLDHSATSPLRPEAAEVMRRILGAPPGNASSVHAEGHRARMDVESARAAVAQLIGSRPDEVIFTSGGTEANNLALFGVAGLESALRRVVTSAFEHPSVAAVVDDLEAGGFEVIRVPPGSDGVVPADAVLDAAVPGTRLVSLMLANNEVGTLQPVRGISRELRRRGVPLHCDAAQAVGKIPVSVDDLGVDLMTMAAHKLGGPQGAGALFVRRGLTLHPHLRGGGQELNRRPGSENVAAIAGFGAAATAVSRGLENEARSMAALRDHLETQITARAPGARINASSAPRVPGISSLAFEGVAGETLVIALDLEGVSVSAGSACSAGTIRRSRSLQAMGLEQESRSSIRVSLGPTTTVQEIDLFVERLGRVLVRTGPTTAASPVPAVMR